MRRDRLWTFLLFVVLLAAGAFYVDFHEVFHWPGINVAGYKNDLTIRQGLDLQGGVQFILQASCPTDQKDCNKAALLPQTVDNINRRISQGLGVNEATVRTADQDRILVQLPGYKDPDQARALLGETGQMNIIDTGGTQLQQGTSVKGQTCTTKCASGQYKIVFTGRQLDTSQIAAGLDPQSGNPLVTFAFSGPAKNDFGKYTRDNIGNFLTITLDDNVIESATIQSEIDGQGQITGIPSVTDAQNLASLLKYGALPLPLTVESEQQLSATLGQEAIDFSLRAAAIGLGMVILFMLIYYRLPGLLADIALVFYALFLVAAIKLLGVTLSLPGIAAVILTIGMAVDANILIFERMKEELRAGRTMASAIDLGFKRAWPSIRDSNFSTLITCFILYFFGNNFGATIIVGFAVNLAVGVLISLFTAIMVTRNFLNILLVSGVSTHPALYGLPESALNLPRYRPSQRRVAQPVRASVAGRNAAVVASAADDDADLDDDEVEVTDVDDLARVGNGRNGNTPAAGRNSDTTSGEEE
jgi:preprotein translocase subunit SecD